jgi:hypothetical protein
MMVLGFALEQTTMNARTQVTLDPEMQRRAQARAAELNISFAEYVRRLLAQDLGESKRQVGVSALFDLADAGPVTNVARDKDKMIAEAILKEHSARGRKKKTTLKLKTGRR